MITLRHHDAARFSVAAAALVVLLVSIAFSKRSTTMAEPEAAVPAAAHLNQGPEPEATVPAAALVNQGPEDETGDSTDDGAVGS